MTRTKALFIAVLAAAACPPAAAQETGYYVGGAIGQASFREACHDFERLSGNVPGSFSCMNKEDTGWKVFGGWRFHRNLAAEISYFDYGKVQETGTIGGAPVPSEAQAKAYGISALGILPVAGSFAAYVRAGLLQVESRTTAGAAVSEDKEIEMHAGIGGLLELTRGWAMRLEYERVNDTKIDLFSIGVQYRF